MSKLLLSLCLLSSVGLSVLAGIDRQAGKAINIHSLHLYKMLNNFREVIAQRVLAGSLPDQNESAVRSLLAPLELVEDAIKKMHEIVQTFNSDDFYAHENQNRNLEIQYKFVNACNLLKDVEKVEPRHLRSLCAKFEIFDQYVRAYCLREKSFLNSGEIDLLNKITQFNQILLLHLLKDEHLNLRFTDGFVDVVFYSPLEFITENPVSTLVSLIAIGGVTWFIVKN